MDVRRPASDLIGPQGLDLSSEGEDIRDNPPPGGKSGPITVTTRDGQVVTVDPDSFTPNDTRARDEKRFNRRQRIDRQRSMQNLAVLADQLGRRHRGEQQLINPTTGMPAVDAVKEFFAPILGHNPKFGRGPLYEEIDRAFAFPAMEFARNVDIARSKKQMLQHAARSGKDVEQVEKDFDRVVTSMRHGIDRGLDPRQALSDAINETGLFGGVGRMGSHSSSDNDALGTGDLSGFGYHGFEDPRNTYGVAPDDVPPSGPQFGPHVPAPRPDAMPAHVPAPRPDIAPTGPAIGPTGPAYGPHQPPAVSHTVPGVAPNTVAAPEPGFVERAFSGVRNFASGVFGAMKAGFSRLAAAGNSHEVYGSVLENRDLQMFGRPGQTLESFREEQAARSKNLIDAVNGTLGGIKDAAQSAWGGIKDAASDTWGGIKDAASDAWGGIKDAAGDAWGGIKDAAGDAWGGIKDALGFGDEPTKSTRRDDDGTSADDAKDRADRDPSNGGSNASHSDRNSKEDGGAML